MDLHLISLGLLPESIANVLLQNSLGGSVQIAKRMWSHTEILQKCLAVPNSGFDISCNASQIWREWGMGYSETVEDAYQKAVKVRERAYAPYSNFKVGAAVKFIDCETIFVGCNVENSSYGSTICAERNAILNGIASQDSREMEFLVLVTDVAEGADPCGMCLQVMSEFCSKETPVYIANLQGILSESNFVEFYPKAFSKEKLPAFQNC